MNRSRLHEADLRRADPLMLEIRLAEPLRRPIVQLSTATMLDMVALAAVETLPKALRRSLGAFADRMSNELTDLPPEPFGEIVRDLETTEPSQVPEPVRAMFVREVERSDREPFLARVVALKDAWEPVVPEIAVPGTGKPVVLKAKTSPIADDMARKPPPTRAAGTPRAAAAPKAAKPVRLVDEDRQRRLVELALDRLADHPEGGLREDVLVAGIRHRVKDHYSDVTPFEIIAVLRGLGEAGRVRHSAGRWMRVMGSW